MTPNEVNELIDRVADAFVAKLSAAERLLDRTQLAEKLAVSIQTVERMAKTKRIPSVKLGRLVRFNYTDVLQALT